MSANEDAEQRPPTQRVPPCQPSFGAGGKAANITLATKLHYKQAWKQKATTTDAKYTALLTIDQP